MLAPLLKTQMVLKDNTNILLSCKLVELNGLQYKKIKHFLLCQKTRKCNTTFVISVVVNGK